MFHRFFFRLGWGEKLEATLVDAYDTRIVKPLLRRGQVYAGNWVQARDTNTRTTRQTWEMNVENIDDLPDKFIADSFLYAEDVNLAVPHQPLWCFMKFVSS